MVRHIRSTTTVYCTASTRKENTCVVYYMYGPTKHVLVSGGADNDMIHLFPEIPIFMNECAQMNGNPFTAYSISMRALKIVPNQNFSRFQLCYVDLIISYILRYKVGNTSILTYDKYEIKNPLKLDQ